MRAQTNSGAIYTGPQLRESGTGGEDDREAEFFIPAGAETWKFPVYWDDNRIGQQSNVNLFNSQQEDRALPGNWQVGARASLDMTVTAAVDNKIRFAADNPTTLHEGDAADLRILLQDASGYPLAAPAGGLTVLVQEGGFRREEASLYAKTGSATEASVSVATAGGIEAATVTIPAGVTEATIPLTITLDSEAEPEETVVLTLYPSTDNPLPTGWSLNTDDGHAERNLTITIPENDQPPAGPPTIGWDRNNAGNILENTGANRTIEISQAVPAGGITLNIGIRDHVGDVQIFQAGTGTQISQVTFAEGETAARRVDFLMVNDNIAEGNETIHIELSLPDGQTLPEGWVFSNRVVTYTITANSGSQQRVGFAAAEDATTTIFRHPTAVEEGNTITLYVKSIAGTNVPAGGFKVNVEATEEDGANGTANANADVTLSASQLTFDENDIFQPLTVTIVDDDENEADELITLQLSAVADDGDSNNGNEALPSGWAFDSSEYTLIIGAENETFVTSTSTTATEGDIVTLTALLPKPAPSDFTMTATSADTSEITILSMPTFAMGDTEATYRVTVVDDNIAEAEEEIAIQLDPTSFPSGSGFTCGEKTQDGETINTCHARVRIQPSDNAIAFENPTSSVARADLEALAAGTTLTHTIAIQANAADNSLPAVPSDITLHLTSNSEAVTTPATLTIPAGLRTANLVLDINPAYIHAENQIARLAVTPDLSDFPAGWDITAATHAITLNAPDKHTIGFAASYLGFLKVDEEQGTQTLNLTLSEPAPAGGLTINLASENTERVTTPATIAIPAGATTATADINIINNQTSGDVTNLLTLSGTLPSDWEFRPHELLLHIVNDDYLIGFPTTTMTVAETSTADITVTVQLSEPAPAGGIIVAVQPSDTGLTPRRIDLRRAILNFPAGTTERSVTFKTIDNTITGDQTVTLTLQEDRPNPLPTSTAVYQTIEGKRYWAIDPDRATFTLTITDDDDDSHETVAFDTANSTSTTFEGDPSAELVITLSAAAPEGTRYDPTQETGETQADFDARKARIGNLSDLAFTIRSSSPDDIRPRNGFIIVPEGATSVNIPLLVLRDDVAETAAEPITFTLIDSSGSTVTYDNNGNVTANTPWWPTGWTLSRATHTITIQPDNHPVIFFDEQFTAVQERDGTVPLRVNLAAPAPAGGITLKTAAVQHHTGNINDTGGFLATLIPSTALTIHRFSTGATCPGGAGTTCATEDISVPETVTIAEGETTIDIPVTINNDYFTEGYEVMEVTIAEPDAGLPAGWELGATGHKIAIFRSDDRQGYVRGWQSITAHTFNEDDATAITRTILLHTAAPKGGIPLKITAAQADDLTITPQSFTIPEGSKTFEVSIAVVNDSDAEPEETITLTIEPGDAGLPSGWGFLPANTRISAGDNTLGHDHDFTIADDND